jgi:hypothetical protein
MLNSQIQSSRQNVKKYEEYPGVLGDGLGNPYARRSRYWVRFPLGTDSNGQTIYSPPRAVRYTGESTLIAREGVEVLVRIDPYDGVETITRIVPDYADRADFDSRILNGGEPISSWVDVKNFIRFLCRPVGSSTQVTIRENPFHVDNFMDWNTFGGTVPSEQPDLDAYIPGTGEHRLLIVWWDFLVWDWLVTASTAQALATDLDSTDYDECFAQLPHHELKPLTALKLADDQATLTMTDVIEDLRTWLPTPHIYGFPNPLPEGKAIILRSTHQEIVFNLTVVGTLTVEGSLTVL